METVSVEVPDPPEEIVTLGGMNDGEGPVEETGETVAAKLTVPVKPLRLVNVMVDPPDEP